MRINSVLACALGAMLLATPAKAGLIYGASSAGGPGELYTIDSANGSMVQDIGALHDGANVNYPITGLAFNPVTGVLFGSTGNSVAATAAKLVTVDPVTALVTVVGSFNAGNAGNPATMSDIEFDAAGNLYGVGSIGGPQLYSINIATGQASVIGSSGLTSTSGGGLAISSAGVIYGTPTSSRFGTYNSITGTFTNIAAPTLPLGGAYAALTFDTGGTLYGLDLGPGPALNSHLVTINPATAAVTDLGLSVSSLDAIAAPVPEPATAGVLLASGVIALMTKRCRRA